MPKRCRASCRTRSGPGRCGASSYPGSSVATFRRLAGDGGSIPPEWPANFVPGQLERPAARGGNRDPTKPQADHPSGRQVAHSTTEIHPGEKGAPPGPRPRTPPGLLGSAFLERRARARPATRAGRAPPSVRTPHPLGALVTLILTTAGLGCVREDSVLAPDPEVTFAAHRAGERLVLDRLPSGARGALEPPGWPHVPDEPTFVLRAGGEVRAALWVVGRSRVLVRRDAETTSPRSAEVLSAWDDGALRLTLFREGGPTLGVDHFARGEGGADTGILTRATTGAERSAHPTPHPPPAPRPRAPPSPRRPAPAPPPAPPSPPPLPHALGTARRPLRAGRRRHRPDPLLTARNHIRILPSR